MVKHLFEQFSNIAKGGQTKKVQQQMKGESKMTEQTTTNKGQQKSLVTYVYGQIYRGYLETGKRTFTIKNIRAQKFGGVLGWLKKNKYIVDFELGNTFETACDIKIKGFNNKELLYKKYIEAVARNYMAETGKVA